MLYIMKKNILGVTAGVTGQRGSLLFLYLLYIPGSAFAFVIILYCYMIYEIDHWLFSSLVHFTGSRELLCMYIHDFNTVFAVVDLKI